MCMYTLCKMYGEKVTWIWSNIKWKLDYSIISEIATFLFHVFWFLSCVQIANETQNLSTFKVRFNIGVSFVWFSRRLSKRKVINSIRYPELLLSPIWEWAKRNFMTRSAYAWMLSCSIVKPRNANLNVPHNKWYGFQENECVCVYVCVCLCHSSFQIGCAFLFYSLIVGFIYCFIQVNILTESERPSEREREVEWLQAWLVCTVRAIVNKLRKIHENGEERRQTRLSKRMKAKIYTTSSTEKCTFFAL